MPIFAKSKSRWLVTLPFLVCTALPAWGQDLGTYSAGQQLILPIDISQLEGEVAIEVDAVDMTNFAAIVDGKLVIDLGAALGDGAHEVTVYLFQGEDYEVLGTYGFSLAGAGSPPPVSVGVQATHDAEVRHVNGETSLDAASSGQLSFNTDDHSVSGNIGYIATSRTFEEIGGKPVNVTEWALQFQQSNADSIVTATFGHQTLGFDPILVDSLNRRGASFSVARHDERLRADFFALSSQALQGAENFTGLEDRDDRIYGMRFGFRPIRGNDLNLSFQLYSGEGMSFGSLVSGKGNGYSFGFDSTERDGRLRYGAHFGMTRWDEDGTGPLVPVSGDATNAYISYDLLSDQSRGRQVTLGLAYDAVDFDFESLANPGLPPGDQRIAVTADYTADRLWLGLIAETRKTNFGGPSDLETDRINLVQLDGTYELQNTGRFDSRSLRFGAYAEWQDREITPAAQPIQDYFDTGFNVHLDQSTARTRVSVGYSLDDLNDQNAVDFDELRQKLSIDLSHEINEFLTMSGGLSSEHVDSALDNWWTHDATLRGEYQANSDWAFSLELASTQSTDDFSDDGFFASLQARRPIGKTAEILIYGSWGDGPYGGESNTTHDAILGVLLSANTNILR